MGNKHRSTIFAALLVAGSLSAQQTWIVDASGAPGSQFVDVQTAVFSAASGDRIEVRGAHHYSGFAIDRGVDVEAVNGATCESIVFVGIPANQSSAAVGFTNVAMQILVANCAGSVLLHDLGMQEAQAVVALQVSNSNRVYASNLSIQWDAQSVFPVPIVRLNASSLVLEQCTILGTRGEWIGGTGATVLQIDATSQAIVSGGVLQGGIGEAAQYQGPGSGCVGPGTAGIGIDGDGHCVILGGAIVRGGLGEPNAGGCGGGVPAAAITASVTATVSAECTIQPSCAACMPTTLASFVAPAAAPLGSTQAIAVHGTPGDLVGIAGDFGHATSQLLNFQVPWLLSPSAVLIDAISIPAGGTTSFAQVIPNVTALQHLHIFYQGVTWSPGSFEATGPTTLHIH
jgi:hypothetical protein